MTIVLSTAPYQQFIDSNGDPLAGGLVYTYLAGTTTPQATYTDQGGLTPSANPIVLDSAGRAEFWLDSTVSYKLIVKNSAGTTIHTTDNISPFNTGTGLSLLGNIAANTIVGNYTSSSASPTALSTSSAQGLLGISQGGFINKFRNPNFDVAQRGTSGSVTTGSTSYTLDGWILSATGATATWSQFQQGVASPYYFTAILLGGATSMTSTILKQRIESTIAEQLVGDTVTVQFGVIFSGTGTVTPLLTIKNATAQDNWASTSTVVNAVSLQTISVGVMQVISYTFTPTAACNNGIEVALEFGTFFANSGNAMYIFNADIRQTKGVSAGLNSNPPVPERRSIAVEYILNRRYLYALNPAATSKSLANGQCFTTTTGAYIINLPNAMRTTPTGITVSNATHFATAKSDGTTQALSALTFANASPDSMQLNFTVGSAVLTAGNATSLITSSSSAQILLTGAEL